MVIAVMQMLEGLNSGDAIYKSLLACCSLRLPFRSLIELVKGYLTVKTEDNAEVTALLQAMTASFVRTEYDMRALIKETWFFFYAFNDIIPMAIASTLPTLGFFWLVSDKRSAKITESALHELLLECREHSLS